MSALTHVRLEDGPFHGDQGTIVVEPPAVIWAFECPGTHARGAVCNQNGIHWCFDELRRDRLVEIFGASMETYAYDRVEAGTFVYSWTALAGGGPLVEREEALA